MRQAREEHTASTSSGTETTRQLEAAQREVAEAASLRPQLDVALSECEQLRTQVGTLQQKADRVERLEDELRSSREEVVRLTQEAGSEERRGGKEGRSRWAADH